MMIKPIGANRQVTLCTKYAGQYVAIEEMELGVWILKLGDFIPRSERWLHDGIDEGNPSISSRWLIRIG